MPARSGTLVASRSPSPANRQALQHSGRRVGTVARAEPDKLAAQGIKLVARESKHLLHHEQDVLGVRMVTQAGEKALQLSG